MGPVGARGPGPCPAGPPGPVGPAGAAPSKPVRVENVNVESGKEVRSSVDGILYVDKARGEVGIRSAQGDRVFVPLKDVLELLRKEVL